MHHLQVKTNIVDSSSETTKLAFAANNQPLCPKPRRLRPALPEFLKPLRCSKHSQPFCDEKSGIFSLISHENITYSKEIEGKESRCILCSPCCYSGPPPRKADNPLVHDVQFIHQMELLSPFNYDNQTFR